MSALAATLLVKMSALAATLLVKMSALAATLLVKMSALAAATLLVCNLLWDVEGWVLRHSVMLISVLISGWIQCATRWG